MPVRFTTALASIGVERVFDGLMMLALMAAAIAAPSFPRQATVGGTPLSRVAAGVALAFGAALFLAFVVALRPGPWLRLLEAGGHGHTAGALRGARSARWPRGWSRDSPR